MRPLLCNSTSSSPLPYHYHNDNHTTSTPQLHLAQHYYYYLLSLPPSLLQHYYHHFISTRPLLPPHKMCSLHSTFSPILLLLQHTMLSFPHPGTLPVHLLQPTTRQLPTMPPLQSTRRIHLPKVLSTHLLPPPSQQYLHQPSPLPPLRRTIHAAVPTVLTTHMPRMLT